MELNNTYPDWREAYDDADQGFTDLNQQIDSLLEPPLGTSRYELVLKINEINEQRSLIGDGLASDATAPQALTALERLVTLESRKLTDRDLDDIAHRGCQMVLTNKDKIMELATHEDESLAGPALRLAYATAARFPEGMNADFLADNLSRISWNATLDPTNKLHSPERIATAMASCTLTQEKPAMDRVIQATRDAMVEAETAEVGTVVYEKLIERAFEGDKEHGLQPENMDAYKADPSLLSYKLRVGEYIRQLSIKRAATGNGDLGYDSDALYQEAQSSEALKAAFARSVFAYAASLANKSRIAPLMDRALLASGIDHAVMNNGFSHTTELAQSWEQGRGDKVNFREYKAMNLDAIVALEYADPGAAQVLANDFGIHNFARYPISVLRTQYRNRDNKDQSYGAMLLARSDHNGAFHASNGESTMIDRFAEELKRHDTEIRIYEVDTPMAVLRALFKARHKYEQELRFALVSGHGRQNSVQFGDALTPDARMYSDKMYMTAPEFQERVTGLFANDAKVVFDSCSTGKDFGVASVTREIFEVDTAAPIRPTKLQELGVQDAGQGRFTIKPAYWNANDVRSYTKNSSTKIG